MFLLLSLFAMTSATSYSRGFLRDMKNQEDKKLYQYYINEGVQQIENSVLLAAKKGEKQFSIYNPGCIEIIENDKRISIERCEYILNEIKFEISIKFPDSDLTFNTQTNQYTLNWS